MNIHPVVELWHGGRGSGQVPSHARDCKPTASAADQPDDPDAEHGGDNPGEAELVGRQGQCHRQRAPHSLGEQRVERTLDRQHEADREEGVLHAVLAYFPFAPLPVMSLKYRKNWLSGDSTSVVEPSPSAFL